ncbi:MAG TPA: redox-regulated ATPase YchF [Thermoprotei archaeon]|nr:redox-regulated ATPase YchF [Thermoprotei archaeon]
MVHLRIGIIGKTNTGKTTFFNAATLLNAEIQPYPFTTKEPNIGIAHVSAPCVCREFGVKDNPRNSVCIKGWRFHPITLIDLPGLIKGAHLGKGLGNQFLSVAAQSDALIHLVDASGSIDAEGNIVEVGYGDPLSDYYDIEEELVLWYQKIIEGNRMTIEKHEKTMGIVDALYTVLSGVKATREHIETALVLSGLNEIPFKDWTPEDTKTFAYRIREVSKPTIVVANKIDLEGAEENYLRMSRSLKDVVVVPASADSELALRRAQEKGLVEYVPGDEEFKVVRPDLLNEKQRKALEYMERFVFSKIMRTGVQFALNALVFKVMAYKFVYPVEDIEHLSDKKGRVLPDVHLLPKDATLIDLAGEIHSEFPKYLLYGVDVRTGLKLPKDYILHDRDIVHLVLARRQRR